MSLTETGFVPVEEIIDEEAFNKMPKISFIGPPSSGKGTAAEIVSRKYNLASTTFSRGIRDHLEYLHGIPQPHSRDLLRPTSSRMQNEFGALAHLTNAMKYLKFELAKHPDIQGFAIDGFRWPQEGYAISQMPNSLVVWMEADQEVRKQRLLERARPGDLTEDTFYDTDNMEIEWTRPLKEFGSVTIINNGNMNDLETQVCTLVEERFGLMPAS